MGRHAGWLAAAAGLAGRTADDAPHLILFPERAFDEADFFDRVRATVERVGYCVVVASEGIRTADGSRAAHFEHTVAVTEAGPRVLTGAATAAVGTGAGQLRSISDGR